MQSRLRKRGRKGKWTYTHTIRKQVYFVEKLRLWNLCIWKITIKWYFSSQGVNDETFQLARRIFSFHFDMFFLLGEPKAILVIKRSKHENWNALSQLKGRIKIPKDGTWLFKSKHTFFDLVTIVVFMVSSTSWNFSGSTTDYENNFLWSLDQKSVF